MTVFPDKRRNVSVEISRKLTDQIKREAKRLAPKECYAIMLGRVNQKGCVVEWLFWPDLTGDNATENYILVRPEWWTNAEETARAKGLQVLGDVHSHCYEYSVDDHAPSEADWDRLARDFIQGICVVSPTKSGKLRASLKFWAAPPNVTMKVSA